MSNHTMGERIKSRRKQMGMTQEQLAHNLGVSPQAVSKWEHGQSCPDISILPDLAALLGISTDELLGKNGRKDTRPVVEQEPKREMAGKESKSFSRSRNKEGVIFAFYILAIGALMLMNRILQIDMSWWTLVWTLGLVFLGIYMMVPKFSLSGLIMCLAGTYIVLSKYGLLRIAFEWSYVLPAVLIIWGIGILVDVFIRKKPVMFVKVHSEDGETPKRVCNCDDGWIECDLSFGEERMAIATECLKGGNIDASFGNFVVDFSACTGAEADCVIDVDNGFGSLTLLFPRHLEAKVLEVDFALASHKIEGNPDSTTCGTVGLRLDNSFGNIVIRYTET